MSSSTAIVNAHGNSNRPKTANVVSPVPTLLCNLCQKSLTTTCFLCACDCIFCEDCTYTHFEHNSNCPTCERTLGENDFTELVIAQATNGIADIAKSSLQALFSKHSKSTTASKALPLSDLCFSLIRQIDVTKQSTKFLLKQLLMDSSSSNRKNVHLIRHMDKMKNEMTQLKQHHSAQRLEYEQMNTELQRKLDARESTIEELHKKINEQEKMLDQFRRMHNGMPGESTSSVNECINQPISQQPTGQGPMNAARQQAAKQQAMNIRRQPGVGLKSMRNLTSSSSSRTAGRYPPQAPPPMSPSNLSIQQHSQISQRYSGVNRPFSSTSSTSSVSNNVPRIRELSSNAGYNFTSTSTSKPHHQHLNKRRKPSTPVSAGGSYYAMSPNTAFSLNQGPSSVSGNGNNGVRYGGYRRR